LVYAGEYKVTFLHSLSDFSGVKPFSAALLKLEPLKGEVFAINGDSVSFFNASGMEVFRIDSDSSIGSIVDIVVASDQKIVLLVNKSSRIQLLLCNYRGEHLGEIPLKGLPAEFKNFSPSRIFGRDKQFYLVSMAEMRLVVIDEQGTYIRSIDIASAIGFSEQERVNNGVGGFALDRDGGFVFTVSVSAKLYTLSGDGKTSRIFGRRGSRPGLFGIPSGVAVDREGNYLVVDKLRCVVMVLDRSFALITEFAKRGFDPGDLIAPVDIIVDNANRAYISNLRKRGVVVYQLSNS
jgi:DNA-binding beta-propeller fold protein YncE